MAARPLENSQSLGIRDRSNTHASQYPITLLIEASMSFINESQR